MANGNGGLLKNVQWLSFSLYLLASVISFAAIGGAFVTMIDTRIERNREHLERVDITVATHSEQIAGMRVSQSATETAAARLEERISAQGETLNRIEDLLQQMLRGSYGPRQRYEESQP